VIFVFATTEPHKVLPTILSRCQRFDLRRIPPLIIARHLEFIAGNEGVSLDRDAAAAIAVAAEGGLRDAESMLDQLVAFCGNSIGESQVLEVFGLTAEHVVADLTRSILEQNGAGTLAIVHQQAEAGKDLTKLLGDLLAFFRNLLIFKVDPQSLQEEISDHARTTLEELAPTVDTRKVLRLIEATSDVEATIKWAVNKKLHLEIALIRAIQTLSEVSLNNVIDALESLRDGSAASQAKTIQRELRSENPVTKAPDKLSAAAERVVTGTSGEAKNTENPAAPEATAQMNEAKSDLSELGEPAWARILNTIRTRRPLIVSWLEQATPFFLERGRLKLAFAEDQQIAVESLSRPNNRKLLEEVTGEIVGDTWELEFELRADLPVPSKPAIEAQKLADPMEEFRNDPMIQKALELFKAEIQSGN
jgi:DNA polymerase III subunit gamma/tau